MHSSKDQHAHHLFNSGTAADTGCRGRAGKKAAGNIADAVSGHYKPAVFSAIVTGSAVTQPIASSNAAAIQRGA